MILVNGSAEESEPFGSEDLRLLSSNIIEPTSSSLCGDGNFHQCNYLTKFSFFQFSWAEGTHKNVYQWKFLYNGTLCIVWNLPTLNVPLRHTCIWGCHVILTLEFVICFIHKINNERIDTCCNYWHVGMKLENIHKRGRDEKHKKTDIHVYMHSSGHKKVPIPFPFNVNANAKRELKAQCMNSERFKHGW